MGQGERKGGEMREGFKYTVERTGDTVTVWDAATGVGLRYIDTGTAQTYTAALIINPRSMNSRDSLRETLAGIVEYAAELLPAGIYKDERQDRNDTQTWTVSK